MGVPEFFVGDVDDATPELGVAEVFLPVGEVFAVERLKFRGEPRFGVDAVGDGADGHFVLGHAGPDVLPQPLADFAVELAHAVGVAAGAQGEDGHREGVHLVDGRLPVGEEVVEGDADLGRVIAEIFLHQIPWESVVARRDRGVGGEDVGCGHELEGALEVKALVLHAPAHQFQREERRVAFVHVVDRRLEPHGVEGVDAADAEHDLLLDAHFEIAAVELRRDEPVFEPVFGDVGVEQEERDAADHHLPHLGIHVAVEDAHGDDERLVGDAHFRHRQMVEVLVETDALLPAVFVDLLFEIAVPVEEGDGDEVDAQVARRLAMVAGEDAEAA